MGFDYRAYTGLGAQTLGGHTQNLVHQDPGERGSDPQQTDPDVPGRVPASLGRRGSAPACCRAGGAECGSACTGPLEGGAIVVTSTIAWPRVK